MGRALPRADRGHAERAGRPSPPRHRHDPGLTRAKGPREWTVGTPNGWEAAADPPVAHPGVHRPTEVGEKLRTHEGTSLTSRAEEERPGMVVAFEADVVDPDTHLGWSVVVTGYARLVTDPAEPARIRRLLRPWAPAAGTDQTVRIHPEQVTGVGLTERGGTVTAPG
ncbi:pyridoxamine 5'-phosphate oxidase family protein [Streptomyces flaveolus]|uniref:pyridoxamine 5'-phosphate oxidase family protein n=1 Tax=Streptomyces flaveolus TaxID=67297 RepID=UPI003F557F7E